MEMVRVVYYLSRAGQLEHPHMIEVKFPAEQHNVLLQDVKKRLAQVRGRGMADSFCWSYKRLYKNNYIWNDLSSDDDPILPVPTGECIMKGSEIYDDECEDKPEANKEQLKDKSANSYSKKLKGEGPRAPCNAPSSGPDYQLHRGPHSQSKSSRTMLLVNDLSKLAANNSLSNSLNQQVMNSLSLAKEADECSISISSDHHLSEDSNSSDCKVYQRPRLPAPTDKAADAATQTEAQDEASNEDDLPPLKSRSISRIGSLSHLSQCGTGCKSPRTPHTGSSRAITPPSTPEASIPAAAGLVEKNMLTRIRLGRSAGEEDEQSSGSGTVTSFRSRGKHHSFRQMLCGVVDIRSQVTTLSPDHPSSTPVTPGWLWRSKSKSSAKAAAAAAAAAAAVANERQNAERAEEDSTPKARQSSPLQTRSQPQTVAPCPPAELKTSATVATETDAPALPSIRLGRPQSCPSPATSVSSGGACTSPAGSYSSSAVESGSCEGSNSGASVQTTSATQTSSSGEISSTPRASFGSRHSFGGLDGDYLELDCKLGSEGKDGNAGKVLPPGFHKGLNDTKLRVRTTPKDGVKDLASPRISNVSRAVAKQLLSTSTGVKYVPDKASPKSTLEWWQDTSSPRPDSKPRPERIYTPGRSSVDCVRHSVDWSRSSIDWSRNSVDGRTLQDSADSMLPAQEFRQQDCLQCGRSFKPESLKAHMRSCHLHRMKALSPNMVVRRKQ